MSLLGHVAADPGLMLLLRVSFVLGAGALAGLALGRASAAARHVLWLAVLAASLAIPVLDPVVPDVGLLPRVGAIAGPVGDRAAASGSPAGVAPTAAAAGTVGAAGGPEAGAQAPLLRRRGLPTAAADGSRALVVLWIAGGLALLARQLTAHASLVRLLRSAARPEDPVLAEARVSASEALGLSRPLDVRVSARVSVPLVAGALRPCVVLPASYRTWDVERLTSVLLHEAAHVARHDVIARLTAVGACVAYWFHPGIWWTARQLRSASERACDDRVVLAGVEPHRYAAHLLEVARGARGRPPRSALAMARATELEGRLLRLLSGRAARIGPSGAATVPGVLAALTVAAVVAALSPAGPEPPSPVGADGDLSAPADAVLTGPRLFETRTSDGERIQAVVRGRVAFEDGGRRVRLLDEASALAIAHMDERGSVRDLYLIQPDAGGDTGGEGELGPPATGPLGAPRGSAPSAAPSGSVAAGGVGPLAPGGGEIAARSAWAWPRSSPDWAGTAERRRAWEAAVLPVVWRAGREAPVLAASGPVSWDDGAEPGLWADELPESWPEARRFVDRTGALVRAVLPGVHPGALEEIGAELWAHLDLRVVWPVAAEAREGHPAMRVSGHGHLTLLYGDTETPVVHASTVAGPLDLVLPAVVRRVLTEGDDPAGARLAASRTPALARAGAALASELERTITTNGRETR